MFKKVFCLLLLTISTHLFGMQALIPKDRSKKEITALEDNKDTQEKETVISVFCGRLKDIEQNATWNDLPRDVRELILVKVPNCQNHDIEGIEASYKELRRLKVVCKDFKNIVESDSTISKLILEHIAQRPDLNYDNLFANPDCAKECASARKQYYKIYKNTLSCLEWKLQKVINEKAWEASDAGKRAKTKDLYKYECSNYANETRKKEALDRSGADIMCATTGTAGLAMIITGEDAMKWCGLPAALSLIFPTSSMISDIFTMDKCARLAGDTKFRTEILKNMITKPVVITALTHLGGKLYKMRPKNLAALDTVVAIGSIAGGYFSLVYELLYKNEK